MNDVAEHNCPSHSAVIMDKPFQATRYTIQCCIKLMFLHKLVRINNPVLKACYDTYSHSVEFTLMCYSFDIAIDLCSESDIRSKVFSAFNHIVHSR